MSGRIRLDTLAQLAAEATPGPWQADLDWIQVSADDVIGQTFGDGRGEDDAAYIAAFSPDVGAALVRAVQAALRHAAAIEHVGDWREAEVEFLAALEPFRETA